MENKQNYNLKLVLSLKTSTPLRPCQISSLKNGLIDTFNNYPFASTLSELQKSKVPAIEFSHCYASPDNNNESCFTCLELHTSHLYLGDSDALSSRVRETDVVVERTYGFLLFIGDAEKDDSLPLKDRVLHSTYSTYLQDIIQWARMHNHRAISFDSTAPRSDTFPAFDW